MNKIGRLTDIKENYNVKLGPSVVKMGRDQTHKVIWNFCFIICLFVFGGWFLSASSGYLEMSASSSVSMKFGDEGDKFVRFPTLTFCKVSLVHDLWRNRLPCKRFSNLNIGLPKIQLHIAEINKCKVFWTKLDIYLKRL